MLRLERFAASCLLAIAIVFVANHASGKEVDISGFVQSGLTIRCSEVVGGDYLDQIEIVYVGNSAASHETTLTVDVFRTPHTRPDQREDYGRSHYGGGNGGVKANVSIKTLADTAGVFQITISVDNSQDSELYQFFGSRKESYVSVGQWSFTNLRDLVRIDEPMLVQESVSFHKGKISNTVNRIWRHCTMLGPDGLYSSVDAYLESQD